jgi:CheY-like chemotaxis protein
MNTDLSPKTCLRVIHLEDDPNDAELIELELKEHGIPCVLERVVTAQEFEEALREGGPDLILSDSKLPGFSTLSALTTARERFPNVPFIFVSGADAPEVKLEALRRGATDFISKAHLPRLTRVIQWLLFGHSSRTIRTTLPEEGMPVIAQCEEFRCLGYLDRDGKWRDFKTSVELPEVIGWTEV